MYRCRLGSGGGRLRGWEGGRGMNLGLNTTLNPTFEGEGTKVLFQIPKSFQAEQFQLTVLLSDKLEITSKNLECSRP